MAQLRRWCYVPCMTIFLSKILIPIAVAAVTIVLLMGLINMMRGGNPNRSQKLMQMRVLSTDVLDEIEERIRRAFREELRAALDELRGTEAGPGEVP